MSDDSTRAVEIERTSAGQYRARNPRGGTIEFGTGDGGEFTPVELLLVAIGGCTAVDVDLFTSRRAEPTAFTVRVTGDKIRDESGNRMENLRVEFAVTFPDGADGDQARDALPRIAEISHERLCSVSRTIEAGTPVAFGMAADAG